MQTRKVFFSLILGLGLVACSQGYDLSPMSVGGPTGGGGGDGNGNGNGDPTQPGGQFVTDTYSVTVASKQIDVLFVIDNSGSMSEEQGTVASSVGTFLSNFTSKTIDYHIGVVSTDAADDPAWWSNQVHYPSIMNNGAGSLLSRNSNPRYATPALGATEAARVVSENIQLGTSGNGAETGLLSVMKFLSPAQQSAWNAGFLRPNALFSMVVVSDEDESMDPNNQTASGGMRYVREDATQRQQRTQGFLDQVRALKPNRPDLLRLDAVVAPSVAECPTVNNNNGVPGTGDVYMEMAQTLHGSTMNICSDFSSGLNQLSQLMAAQAERRFTLRQPLQSGSTLTVKVDGVGIVPDPIEGFTYDAATNQIELHGMNLEQRSSFKVEVTYQAQ